MPQKQTLLQDLQDPENPPDHPNDQQNQRYSGIHHQSKQALLLVSTFKSNLHPKPPIVRKIQRRCLEREMTGVGDDLGVGNG
jgi:hypothetical protein